MSGEVSCQDSLNYRKLPLLELDARAYKYSDGAIDNRAKVIGERSISPKEFHLNHILILKPRGTALIFREDRVLLVRNNIKRAFSLPGGGIHDMREPPIAAACREVSEDLDLEALSAKRLPNCDHASTKYFHKVVLVQLDEIAEPKLCGRVVDYIWWDTHERVSRYPHVDEILEKYHYNANKS